MGVVNSSPLCYSHVCHSVLPGELPRHKQCHNNNTAGLTFTVRPGEEIMTIMLEAECMIIIPVTISMSMHSWLFQGGCQECFIPDELRIHFWICSDLSFPFISTKSVIINHWQFCWRVGQTMCLSERVQGGVSNHALYLHYSTYNYM